jgi:hypothetical protein
MERKIKDDLCKELPSPTMSIPDTKDKDWETFICKMMTEVHENQMKIFDIIMCYMREKKNEKTRLK